MINYWLENCLDLRFSRILWCCFPSVHSSYPLQTPFKQDFSHDPTHWVPVMSSLRFPLHLHTSGPTHSPFLQPLKLFFLIATFFKLCIKNFLLGTIWLATSVNIFISLITFAYVWLTANSMITSSNTNWLTLTFRTHFVSLQTRASVRSGTFSIQARRFTFWNTKLRFRISCFIAIVAFTFSIVITLTILTWSFSTSLNTFTIEILHKIWQAKTMIRTSANSIRTPTATNWITFTKNMWISLIAIAADLNSRKCRISLCSRK